MGTELGSIVRGYRADCVSVGEQHSDNYLCQRLWPFALGKSLHKHKVGTPLCEGEDCTLAIPTHNGVHLPVSEACTVRFCGSLMNAHTIGNIPDLCSAIRSAMTVILHLMATMGGKFPGFIRTDMAVYKLMGDMFSTFSHVIGDLFGRSILFGQKIQSLPDNAGILDAIGSCTSSAFHCLGMGLVPQIVTLFSGIPSYLTAEC